MKDFIGKLIKVFVNSNYGYICVTGPFVKIENNFLVIVNQVTKKIEYYSMYNVKTVTIIRDIVPEDLSEK